MGGEVANIVGRVRRRNLAAKKAAQDISPAVAGQLAQARTEQQAAESSVAVPCWGARTGCGGISGASSCLHALASGGAPSSVMHHQMPKPVRQLVNVTVLFSTGLPSRYWLNEHTRVAGSKLPPTTARLPTVPQRATGPSGNSIVCACHRLSCNQR